MQMMPGRAPGRALNADYLAFMYPLLGLHQHPLEMRIAGRKPIFMLDIDHVAIGRLPAGEFDFAVLRRQHLRMLGAGEIHPAMKRHRAAERVDPHPETAGLFIAAIA